MNGRITSTQWIPSLSERTVSSGEVTLSFFGILEYELKIEDPEGDLGIEQWEKDGWNLLCKKIDRENPKLTLGYWAV